MSAGIDYGLGRTNIDHETGIRYGVISQHSVAQAWSDSSEPDYGEATCPKCGNKVENLDAYESYRKHSCADYVCEDCKITLDSEDVFSEEALGWNVDDGEYVASNCLDSDIIITKSPYFTFAKFCSPCVPGAGDLDSASEDGVKSYCFGHNWFEDGKAPYPVYSVETGELVKPD